MLKTLLKQNEQTLLIDGPAGKLELIISKQEESTKHAWGIVCHPHPLYGGTMHNKVVTTLSRVMQNLGITTVRFNFRGIGQSQGSFDQGRGEFEDLLAVMDWLQRENIEKEIWLAGFSFGAYIAAKAATRIPVKKLILVAPPVEHFPMQSLGPFMSPMWVLAQGDQDEFVPARSVYEWANERTPKPIILKFPEATHFFHGQLQELRVKLEEALG